ncbi:hypothetical protein GGF43_000601 [Coemansia sp. RSA 2618]|nr:hypothetical protein GGF43_000601 [Coemansia sp. RSA 2618]
MISNKFFALLAATVLAVVPGTAAYESNRYRPKQDCIMYEVRPGDYCYKIARTNGISYEQLLRQNPGLDCTNLQIGRRICLIPHSPDTWNSGGNWGGWNNHNDNDDYDAGSRNLDSCRWYVVKEGDLCSHIAENHGHTFAELVEMNEDTPDWNGCKRLYAGQNICV